MQFIALRVPASRWLVCAMRIVIQDAICGAADGPGIDDLSRNRERGSAEKIVPPAASQTPPRLVYDFSITYTKTQQLSGGSKIISPPSGSPC